MNVKRKTKFLDNFLFDGIWSGKQKIEKDQFNRLFLDSKAIRDGVVDVRRIARQGG